MTNSNPFAAPDGEAEANNSNTTQNQGGANTVGANQAGVPNPATYSAQNATDTANPAQTSAETAPAQTSNGASYANPTYSHQPGLDRRRQHGEPQQRKPGHRNRGRTVRYSRRPFGPVRSESLLGQPRLPGPDGGHEPEPHPVRI